MSNFLGSFSGFSVVTQCLIAKWRSDLFNIMSHFKRPIWSTFLHPIWPSLTAPLFYLPLIDGFFVIEFCPLQYFSLSSIRPTLKLKRVTGTICSKMAVWHSQLPRIMFCDPVPQKDAFHPASNGVLEPRGTATCSDPLPGLAVDSNF